MGSSPAKATARWRPTRNLRRHFRRAHPVAVDCVAATLMGFDWEKLSLLRKAFEIKELDFTPFSADQIELISNRPEWNKRLVQLDVDDAFHFRPHFGWKGAISASDSCGRQPARATSPTPRASADEP